MGLDIGDRAADFRLRGVDGSYHSLSDYQDAELICVIFTCNHCPYAQAYEERINALQDAFDTIQILAINANDDTQYPEDSYEEMIERAETHDYLYPYLHDEAQAAATRYGATHTPEAFLFDRDRILRYRGRIDDNWRNAGAVQDTTLRTAIAALLAGKSIAKPIQPAIGCSIKWK